MEYADSIIGGAFWCSDRQWCCTDIGTRRIAAIRIDRVTVGSTDPKRRRTLSRAAAEAEGFFNGPPYAVAEVVFNEYGQEACSLKPDADDLVPESGSV